MNDSPWHSVLQLVASYASRHVIVPPLPEFLRFGQTSYAEFDADDPGRFDLFVLHKNLAAWFPEEFVMRLCHKHSLLLDNEVFLVFGPPKSRLAIGWDRENLRRLPHVQSVISSTELRQRTPHHDQLLVFVHITKCAGTTVFSQLKQQFPRNIYLVGGNDTLRGLPRALDQYSLIGGHFSRSDVLMRRSGRPMRWLTILRDPAKRFLSELAHGRRPVHRVTGDATKSDPIEDARTVLESPEGRRYRITMLRYLERQQSEQTDMRQVEARLSEVEEFIAREDVIFGFQEDLAGYYRVVNKALGIDLEPTVRLNSAPNYNSITPEERSFVQDQRDRLFQYDLQLYQRAQEIYKAKYREILELGNASLGAVSRRNDATIQQVA